MPRANIDVLIKGGSVIDGTGSEPFAADVAVTGGRIVDIGQLGDVGASRTISAAGLYVVPGLVDMHIHSERGLYIPELAPSLHLLKQGVTTVVGGPDGYGSWPLHETIGDHIAKLEDQGIGTNAVLMVGSGQVRRLTMGTEEREPTCNEMAAMKRQVREAMEGGAWGLSSGLEYPPGNCANTEEVIGLASEAAPFRGMYHTHMRSESDNLLNAVEETIRIIEEAGVIGVLTHFKAAFRRNWGKVTPALELIEEARRRGVRVYADQFPFAQNEVRLIPESTWLDSDIATQGRVARVAQALEGVPVSSLLDLYAEMAAVPDLDGERRRFLNARPEMLREMVVDAVARAAPSEGGSLMALASWYGVHRGPGNPEERARFRALLNNREEGALIRRQIAENLDRFGGADEITIVTSVRTDLEGRSLAHAAESMDLPVADAAVQLGLENAQAMGYLLSEDDVVEVMRKDFVATGSDGDYPYFGGGIDPIGIIQHLRSYATFSTKLRHYALDRGIISLPHAIRSCTGLSAEILGWRDRGLIKEGYWADITVFNPETIAPKSTPRHPHRYSEGIEYVLVNGEIALGAGQPSGALAGRVLRIQDR